MKDRIRGALENATALDQELHLIRAELGSYQGEQLTEAKTEKQLDRWTQERDLGDAIDAAVKHMSAVLEELRWVQGKVEK